jgi:heme/copper-type cytochrome/quinol oxidase subunit 2
MTFFFIFIEKTDLTCERMISFSQCSLFSEEGKFLFCQWDYSSENCKNGKTVEGNKRANILIVILAIMGTVVLIITCIIAIILWKRRRKRIE